MIPYYQDLSVTIYHGQAQDIIPHIGSVDHIITDAPYSAKVSAGARTRKDMGPNESTAFIDFHITAPELRNLIASIPALRWAVVFCDWRHGADLENEPPIGWRFVREGCWTKPNGAPQFSGDRPGPGWEAISILHTEGGRMRWNGGGKRAVWDYGIEKQNGHPTPKPLALMTDIIALFSDPGEMILDPFMGSGTTLRAAKDLGRKAIGIELEEKYCELAANRMIQEVLSI
jgi:site-specific DNA-methyltransferase (adenine-specific)